MKTLTCKQMGGPCDAQIQAENAEEMMQKGGEHVNEMAKKGDEGHIKAKEMMDAAGTNPEELKKWQDQFMQTYDAAPTE